LRRTEASVTVHVRVKRSFPSMSAVRQVERGAYPRFRSVNPGILTTVNTVRKPNLLTTGTLHPPSQRRIGYRHNSLLDLSTFRTPSWRLLPPQQRQHQDVVVKTYIALLRLESPHFAPVWRGTSAFISQSDLIRPRFTMYYFSWHSKPVFVHRSSGVHNHHAKQGP